MPTDKTSQGEANRNKDKLNQDWKKDDKSTEFGKTNDPNYDPSLQNQGIDAGKPSNPDTPTIRNMNQNEGDLHPVVMTDDRLKTSGKHAGGLPNEPIVSFHPTSGTSKSTKQNIKPITNGIEDLLGDYDYPYELKDVEAGDGVFVGIDPGKTHDQLIFEAYGKVNKLNEYWSVPDLTDEGEEISDQVIVHEFKRNDDKTIQLNDKSKPVTGASHQMRKRRIPLRLYVVKSVTAGEKFDDDGVLIVRVI